nr:ATP-binding protein [Rhodococcus opacus]
MRIDTWNALDDLRYDRSLPSDLVSLRFAEAGHSVLVRGPVGVVKTRLATALGHVTIRRRMTVLCARADKLFARLRAARLDNSVEAEMRRIATVDLLILDPDPGLIPTPDLSREFQDRSVGQAASPTEEVWPMGTIPGRRGVGPFVLFGEELRRLGHRLGAVRHHRVLMGRLDRWLTGEGLAVEDLSVALVEAFLGSPTTRPNSSPCCASNPTGRFERRIPPRRHEHQGTFTRANHPHASTPGRYRPPDNLLAFSKAYNYPDESSRPHIPEPHPNSTSGHHPDTHVEIIPGSG